jgi:hypothetical protein
MQNSVAKKIFAVGSAVVMTLALVAPFVAVAAVHAAGTNVSDSSGTVWMIMPDGTRRAYTSAGAFLSYGFNSWSQVVAASAEDLALPVSSLGFIPPQDGSIICSDRNDSFAVKGTCYEISGGQKFGFTSSAVFTGLGFSFANSSTADVSWMQAGSQLLNNTTAAHLPGTLVNNNGTVQLMGNSGLLGIPDVTTFNSWGYSFGKVVPANAADKAMTQTGVMAARVAGQLSPTALASTGNPTCTSNCTPVVSGSVSATLASDSPAAGTIVASSVNNSTPGQTGADLAHFNFTGSGTVTQVVINRIGVSADNSFSNVYLYQGNNRITSAGSFSSGMVTFTNSNGLFTVNGSAEISVRVDVAAGAGSGQTVGAQLASFTVANGTPATTSISGNLFQVAAVSNLATAQLSVAQGATPNGVISSGATGGTAGTLNAGTSNAILWQTPVNIGQRTVLLKHIAFTQIGSIQSSAITNLQFYVDGTAVGTTGTLTTAGGQTQVVFDFTGSPVSLSTGSHTLSLEGNVIGGTSFTFEYSLQTAVDAVFYDTNYNVNIPLTYSGGGSIFQLAPGLTTINSGTVSVQSDPADTATQFVTNSSQVLLGQWDLTAYGENVNVNQLQVKLTYTGTLGTSGLDGFNNLSVYVNGGTVGSSQSALGATSGACSGANAVCTYSFGTTNLFTIQAGQTVVVQVKGDSVVNGTDITGVQASLVTPAQTIQGQTSYALSPVAITYYAANTLTTGTGYGTLAKNTAYSNQTIGSNQNNQEIGSYVIQASSIDGVRVNQLTVAFSGSSTLNNNGAAVNTNFTPITTALPTMYLSVTYPGGSATTTPVNPSASNTFTLNNVTIPANQTATVNVMANVSNATGTVITTLSGTGQGLTSNQSVTLAVQTGQTITVGNGTLAAPILQTSSPVASFVIGGQSNQPAATFNFVANSGGATIEEMDFTTATTSGATTVPVSAVTVGGVTSTMVGSTSTVTGLSIAVPATYSGVDVPVTMNLTNVGLNGIPSNQQFTLKLVAIKYLSGSATQWSYPTNLASNPFDLVGSAPTVTLTSSGNTLTTGNITVGSITISANSAGNVIASSVPLSISASNATISGTLQLVDTSNSQVAGQVTGLSVQNGASTTTVSLTTDNNVAAESSKTYNILVPVTAISGSNSYSVTVGLASPPTGFTFKDVNGNASNVPAAVSSVTIGGVSYSPTYIVNYPTNTITAHQ